MPRVFRTAQNRMHLSIVKVNFTLRSVFTVFPFNSINPTEAGAGIQVVWACKLVYKEQITCIYAKSERLILLEGVILGFC